MKRFLRNLCTTIGPLCILAVVAHHANAEACKAPENEKLTAATIYAAKHYHITSSSGLSLVEYSQVSASCFWRLHFQVASTKRDMMLFLSPDQKYLTSTLFDLDSDPLEEERSQAEATLRSLMSGDPPARGDVKAKVTIIEFADFECPYCKRMKDMLEKEVSTGDPSRVRLVFRNFPLAMHPWAKAAAQIAECVELQNSADFWKVHDFLFDNQQSLTAQNITDKTSAFISANTAIDQKQFQACIDKDLAVGPVMQELDLGQKNGVHGTPTLFINGFRSDPIRDDAQLHAIIEAVERGENPLGVTVSGVNNSGGSSIPAGQCSPSNRTGVGDGSVK